MTRILGFLSAAAVGPVVNRIADVAKAVTKDKPQGNIWKLDLTLIKGRVILGALGLGRNVRTALGCAIVLWDNRVVVHRQSY